MDEIDFINAVLAEADCDLLLDVNNIYVNSINHRYDAEPFLKALPAERIVYFHIAGHYDEADDLKVDTPRRTGHRPGVVTAGNGLRAFWRGPDTAGTRLQHPAAAGTAGGGRSDRRPAVEMARSARQGGHRAWQSMPEFIRRQYAFAANIRDPENNPAPEDIEDRRMQIYRELFYNNVENFISGTFPVLRRIYSDADWHGLVREYFSRHRSRTPLFHEIPREFLNWLETGTRRQPCRPAVPVRTGPL